MTEYVLSKYRNACVKYLCNTKNVESTNLLVQHSSPSTYKFYLVILVAKRNLAYTIQPFTYLT